MVESEAVDWARWHDPYDEKDSWLARRLVVVQERIRELLDRAAPGPIRIVSICAGQGRDLLPVVAAHPRGEDVHARLVELDPRNVAVIPVVPNIEIVQGDAALLSAYEGAVPAEIVLACGVFGNIAAEDIRRTIEHLPMLCTQGGSVIWTRGPRKPDLRPAIRGWFADYGFEEEFFLVEPDEFGVGVHRFTGEPQPLDPAVKLFTFVR
jgi:hypothetical protein